MHKKLQNIINNCSSQIDFHKSQDNRLKNSNLFENAKIKRFIQIYWDDVEELNSTIQIPISRENFIDELKKDFPPIIEENKTFIQDYFLEPWVYNSQKNIDEIRFKKYKNALRGNGLGGIADQLDNDTYTILNNCHNPNSKTDWDRRGLVYGHVQSGKTANFIGLINRALDHGYKIVIILTGMTEDLRKQTQERVDGYINFRRMKGTNIKLEKPTNIIDDFSSKFKDQHDSRISYKDSSIWVIKKNKTVLENLILWFHNQIKDQGNNEGFSEGILKHVPVLIIDDEADNASIQSLSKKQFDEWELGLELQKKKEDELTESEFNQLKLAQESVIKAINRNIRVLLSLIGSKTFVSYTATPYSVVTQIYEDIKDRKPVTIGNIDFKITAGDLFPEHFINPIHPGKTYLGIERLFNNNEERNIPVILNLDKKYNEDYENIFPTKRGSEYDFDKIPDSLADSIIHYITSIIIKKHRGIYEHNTMLVHTSHLTLKADYLADKIENYVSILKEKTLSNDKNILIDFNNCLNKIKINSKNKLFKEYFDLKSHFPQEITHKDLFDTLKNPKNNFNVVSYHSSKNENLLHKNHDLIYSDLKDDEGNSKYINYIVIGGNRLSRGLTLMGLIVSYFVRSSTRQDSLYQMGRWFGYRGGYEDLIKIIMPNDHILWYNSIFNLETDLRKDFEKNNDPDHPILPRNAVIKLSHEINEDNYLDISVRKKNKFPYIGDPGKLRKTQNTTISHNGPKATRLIQLDKKISSKNLKLVYKLFDKLYSTEIHNKFDISKLDKEFQKNSNISFTNIPQHYIIELLNNYSFHPKEQADMNSFIDFIIQNSNNVKEWSVSLVNRSKNKTLNENPYNVSKFYEHDKETSLNYVKRGRNKEFDNNSISISSIIEGRGVDSTFDIINSRNKEQIKELFDAKGTEFSRTLLKLRSQYKKPLLVIYPVKDISKNGIEFPLLYFYYPVLKNARKVTYKIRKSYE
jgi:hypothetical protein